MRFKFKWSVTLLLVFIMQIVFSQEKTITGTITDGSLPIPGVSVLIKGSKTGTQSDFDGRYSIKAEIGQTLVFSFVGMKTQEINVSSSTVDVVMRSSAMELESVVVTALGIKREKKSLGYATQMVKEDEILKSGKTNVLDALNGKVSGVQITNSGGQAGSGTNVVIRGYASITGNNQPLYVVDGVPIDNSSESTGGLYDGTPAANRATDIAPEDVASVSILKGGAASALYGIRAQNGVILITTKRGKSGTFNVDLSTSYSSDSPNKFPALSNKFTTGSNGLFNAATTNNWGPLSNDGTLYPAGLKRDMNGDGVLEDIGGTPIISYNDNYKRFFRDGNTQKYNVAFSGGGEKSTFYASVSNSTQNGIIPNQNYKKTSALFSATQKFSDKLDMDVKANYITTSGKFFDADLISGVLGYFNNNYDVKNYPYQDPYGNKTYWHGSLSHPMWTVNKTGEDRKLDRLLASLGLNYKMAKNLTLSYKLGVDTYAESRLNYRSIGTAETVNNNYLGSLAAANIKSKEYNSDLFLRYEFNINDDFKISSMVGHNFNQQTFDRLDNLGSSFIVPNLFDIQNTTTQQVYHYSTERESMSVFGDVTASYKNILFLTATGRNDWNSTLPKANNNFFYPSLSGSFVFSELVDNENFFGKLRASYARTANVPPVAALNDVYIKQGINYFGNAAFTLSNAQLNPTLKPENILQWEVGTELGFFKNKVNLDVSYYSKKSVDQIVNSPVSNVTGYSSRYFNIGEIQNKGIEATLKFNDIITTEDFHWTSEFNFSRNRGVVNKVGDNVDTVILASGWWTNAQLIAKEGLPMGTIFGYTYEHSVPGDLSSPLLVDANGYPMQSAERTVIGNTQADFILGWNSSFSYKGFNAGFTLERKQGGDIINDYKAQNTYSGHASVTDNRYYTTGTTIKGTQNFNGVDANGAPVATAAQLTKGFYTTTFVGVDTNFIEDASWWRLRNIYIGYSLPKKFLSGIKVSNIDFTLSGRNLWLSTKYSGVDPEVNSRGVGSNGAGIIGFDANSIPNTKSIDFSVKIKL